MIFGCIDKYGEEISYCGGTGVAHTMATNNDALSHALKLNYDSFDTSPKYGNEDRISDLLYNTQSRIISKLPCVRIEDNNYGYDNVIKCFEDSYKHLKITDYLIHWPIFPQKYIKSTWEGFEYLKKRYNIRIGVSNFHAIHLEKIFDICHYPPEINQIEINVYLQNSDLVQLCQKHNIEIMSYSSIARGRREHFLSIENMIRWLLYLNINPIIRSKRFERLWNFLNFKNDMTEKEYNLYKQYDIGYRLMPNPSIYSPWS
jgi:diketogulonate reductase-like aldo/keto reductase